MEIIQITPEKLKIVLQDAMQRALHIRQSVQNLPERCSFKDVLEISGLKESSLYETTKNMTIPFENKLIFSHRDLQAWETKKMDEIIDDLINDLTSIKKTSAYLFDEIIKKEEVVEF